MTKQVCTEPTDYGQANLTIHLRQHSDIESTDDGQADLTIYRESFIEPTDDGQALTVICLYTVI